VSNEFFAFAEQHSFGLIRLPYGRKGANEKDWPEKVMHKRSEWQACLDQGACNFGVVAGASRLLIFDIDVKHVGRDRAWQEWDKLCKSWGLPGALTPHCSTANQGWHVYVKIPDGVEASTLRTTVLVRDDEGRELIGARVGNSYTVAPGSYFDSTGEN